MCFKDKVRIFCYNYAGGAQTCRTIVNFLSFNFAKRKFTSTTFWNIFGGTVVKIITFCSLIGSLSFKNLDIGPIGSSDHLITV